MLGSNRGFSLIEMMAALLFLAVSLVGLAALPVAAVKAASHARNVTSATNLALDKIEDLRGADWETLASGSDAGVTPSADETDSPSSYAREWTVAGGPAAATKQVAVTVTWQHAGPHQVTLRTVITE